MPCAPKHRAEPNLCRRKPKHQAMQYERWLHLSSGETNLQFTLQVSLCHDLCFHCSNDSATLARLGC